ncbi:hypothetical protein [Kitasatospora phosalacinea]|uniref:Uncharacterized protein n=1 Tax=Kitasatospora phosalacinea TaxID=2065 RepID=A0A9W6PNS4_9ACTN|nr:hypothetical protein [Kitasatospora phosalacinea]GLW58171.1 hypothetical protein Kpho01_61820 [Kitasatospora phosalacinea]
MPADISFTPGPDGAIIARTASHLPDSALRILEQQDAVKADDGSYLFAGSDAVARAARTAFFLNVGGLRVDTVSGPLEPHRTFVPDGADIVFARHPAEGIVAAAATDATEGLVPEILNRFGFTHDSARDIYLQPFGLSEREALVAAARASLVLQTLGVQVATRGLAARPAFADRLSEAVEDLAVERVNIRTLTDSGDIADLLDAASDQDTGALSQLSGLLDDIGRWASGLPVGQDQQIAGRIDEARIATEVLHVSIAGLQRELVGLDAVLDTPAAPALSARSARSSAATASTAHALTGGPILQSPAPAPSAVLAQTAPAASL